MGIGSVPHAVSAFLAADEAHTPPACHPPHTIRCPQTASMISPERARILVTA